jgi:hypothetical protein
MNFKSIMTGAAIAASVGIGSAVVAAPANAARLNFDGTVRIQNVAGGTGNPLVVNFRPFGGGVTGTAEIESPTDVVFGFEEDDITLKDLTLNNTGLNRWSLASPVTGFITGLAGGTVTFDLNSFNLLRVTTGDPEQQGFFARYTGIFSNFPDAAAIGSFTTQLSAATNSTGAAFSSTATVPTPALLPGLVGLGVAALRKRKGEGSEAEKETVGVKA